jgi:hypothetical protein
VVWFAQQLQLDKGELVARTQTLTSQLDAQHDLNARLQAEQVRRSTDLVRAALRPIGERAERSGNRSGSAKRCSH